MRHDLVGLRQSSGTAVGAGQASVGRFDDRHPALPQQDDVGGGRGVPPHLGMHGRCQHHGAVSGEQGGGQQVVGQAGRGFGEQVRRGGSDDDEVGLLTQGYMTDIGNVLPHCGADRVAGKRLPRRSAHEAEGGLGRDDGDIRSRLCEETHHMSGLVRRDSPAHPHDDPEPGHGHGDYSVSTISSVVSMATSSGSGGSTGSAGVSPGSSLLATNMPA